MTKELKDILPEQIIKGAIFIQYNKDIWTLGEIKGDYVDLLRCNNNIDINCPLYCTKYLSKLFGWQFVCMPSEIITNYSIF